MVTETAKAMAKGKATTMDWAETQALARKQAQAAGAGNIGL